MRLRSFFEATKAEKLLSGLENNSKDITEEDDETLVCEVEPEIDAEEYYKCVS